MRTDAVRFATSSSQRPLPALRYESIRNGPEHDFRHGLTARRVCRHVAHVLCAEEVYRGSSADHGALGDSCP
jgi:hypothetical protein